MRKVRKEESRRDFKNSVFVELFNDKARLLELYNAIGGTSYDDPNQITIKRLKGVLYHGQYNDISFTILSEPGFQQDLQIFKIFKIKLSTYI